MTTDAAEHISTDIFKKRIREIFRTPLYWVIAGLITLYGLTVYIAALAIGRGDHVVVFSYMYLMTKTTAMFFCIFMGFRFLYILLVQRPESFPHALSEDIRDKVFSAKRILQALPIILLFPIFFSFFTSYKNLIPFYVPFSYDLLFAKVDAFIHGGRQPWEILQPVLGFAVVSFVIASIYKLWFLTKFCTLYWQAFSTSLPIVRAQFFLTSMLAWIINGSIFATIFSSAGPCFFHFVLPDIPNPYEGLMNYLNSANEHYRIWDIPVQNYLWQNYLDKDTLLMSGISAFPSMHVSYAFIFLLTASHYGRIYTAFFAAFFLFTIVGSIHLGWHYAVDGYFSVLTTWLIWVLCGQLVRKFKLHEPCPA